jgi:hypothetical protein
MNIAVGSAALATALRLSEQPLSNATDLDAQLSVQGDPIFAAIEAHKTAMAAAYAAVDVLMDLERVLPSEQRRSSITVWEEEIVETDDPRWIDSERAVHQSYERETEAAIDLVSVRPTTQAGLFALLQYAIMTDQKDRMAWPSELHSDDERDITRSWHYFLLENIAAALTLGLQADGTTR